MPVHDGSGSNQDERLPPPGPEHSQGNPEQLVQDSQSTARSLRVQSQQLLMESQVLKDELLVGAESAEQPAEQMSERHDHVKNLTEASRIQLCAKSFILQVYDVLARHRNNSGTRVVVIQVEVLVPYFSCRVTETLSLPECLGGFHSCGGFALPRGLSLYGNRNVFVGSSRPWGTARPRGLISSLAVRAGLPLGSKCGS
jgi:hypothetical protein